MVTMKVANKAKLLGVFTGSHVTRGAGTPDKRFGWTLTPNC
jgi:hypothetical protein